MYLPLFLQQRLSTGPQHSHQAEENALPRVHEASHHVQPSGAQAIASHLMELELMKNTLASFSGREPQSYGPWITKLDSYMSQISILSPLKVLQILEGHCTGEPQRMVQTELSSPVPPSWETVADVYHQLEERYGSKTRTAAELLRELNTFDSITDECDGEKLHKLARLCKAIVDRQHTCPNLLNLNFALGLEQARRLLPRSLQFKWADIGQEYEDNNDGRHPEFRIFYRFVLSCANKRSNPNYAFVSDNRGVKPGREKPTYRVMKTNLDDRTREPAKPQDSPTRDENNTSRVEIMNPCPIHPEIEVVNHTIYRCKKF